MVLDEREIGEFLSELDDAPIPLPWRGRVYYAPPPDVERGRQIAAYWALVGMGSPSREDLEKVLQGQTAHELMIGKETCAQILAAGMPRDGKAFQKMATLCMVRWATGSEEKAREYLAAQRAAQEAPPAEEPAQEARPKSRARSRRKRSPSTASGLATPTGGSATT